MFRFTLIKASRKGKEPVGRFAPSVFIPAAESFLFWIAKIKSTIQPAVFYVSKPVTDQVGGESPISIRPDCGGAVS
jgi:hypothetical protein